MKRFVAVLLALAVLSLLVFAGCSAAAKKPGPAENPRTTTEANEKALRIAREADAVNGVKKSTVVVTENKAYIGLDIMSNLEKGQTKAVEKAVINAVKGVEPTVKTVYVSSDADTVTRLKKISQGIAGGQPVASFARELNEIGRRITPTTM